MEREKIERAQFHAAGTERRMDEVARLEDRIDLVLPGIELPEPRQPEQGSNRKDEEQRALFLHAGIRRFCGGHKYPCWGDECRGASSVPCTLTGSRQLMPRAGRDP